MRINRYVADATGLSRRKADQLIRDGKISVDNEIATIGQNISLDQSVALGNIKLKINQKPLTILFNKPVGYVVSRKGQGSKTIYSLLPKEYSKLNPIGRLDKDSSGLLLLSSSGHLIQSLSHPSKGKQKTYQVDLDRPLNDEDKSLIKKGIRLNDGLSKLDIIKTNSNKLTLVMTEGRNRQIRRTFEALGYRVTRLNRIAMGEYKLGTLKTGKYIKISD